MLTLTLTAICWATTAHAARSWEQRPHGPPPDELTVPTTSGHVAGKIDPEYPNVRQFLGIPFAEAPVGERRWAAPEPLSQPDAWVDARRLPPSCPQFLTSTGQSAYTREFLEFNLQGLNRTGDISEDCLTLSVWTPTEEECERGRGGEPDALSGGLPVFIYIYGGSFSTGGQDVPYQIPTQWVSRSPDHIVVSFNYRVNIFGHPGNPQLERNPGLLDQRLAVEWVKENIAHFGGDPTKMVLWGQSAGSASVDFYNFAYPEDPIVSGLIMDSGTALLPIRGDPSGRNFSHVASQVGCPGLADNPSEEIACMRKVDALKIESFIANYSDSGTSPGLSFGPVPDEKTVFANYTARALDGKQAQIVRPSSPRYEKPSC
jgi:carboxylesterase type B